VPYSPISIFVTRYAEQLAAGELKFAIAPLELRPPPDEIAYDRREWRTHDIHPNRFGSKRAC